LCHRQGHIQKDCPEKEHLGIKPASQSATSWRKEPGKVEIKKEVVDREMPVEDESESEFPYSPVPSIRVPAQVKEALMKALIDCGAEGDLIAEKIVQEQKLPTIPIKPV
jgi:hypothetical protein